MLLIWKSAGSIFKVKKKVLNREDHLNLLIIFKVLGMVLELHLILLVCHNAIKNLKIIYASRLMLPGAQRYLSTSALNLEFYSSAESQTNFAPPNKFSHIPPRVHSFHWFWTYAKATWAATFWSKQAKGRVLKLDSYTDIGLPFALRNGITVGFGLDFYLPVLKVQT